MRYTTSEKFEIIQLVEKSHLSAKQTLDRIGIPKTTFYRRHDRFMEDGIDGLEDPTSRPSHVWNRTPDKVHRKVIDLALEQPELSPRELAVRFSDQQRYFVSESSIYHESNLARDKLLDKRHFNLEM